MTTIVCPCCEGKGRVPRVIPMPTPLPPLQARIYRAIKRRSRYLNAYDLIDVVYGDHTEGGPTWAANSIRVLIYRANEKLKPFGEQIRSTKRGAGGVYYIDVV